MNLRKLGAATATALVLALALGAGSAAAWTTQQGGGTVLVQHRDQGWTIELRCQRVNQDVLGFTLIGPNAASMAGLTEVYLFVTYPSGDRVRTIVPVRTRGQTATADWRVNSAGLEQFAQGTGLGIGLNGPDDIVLRTNMTGTYAARTAIQGQCRF